MGLRVTFAVDKRREEERRCSKETLSTARLAYLYVSLS